MTNLLTGRIRCRLVPVVRLAITGLLFCAGMADLAQPAEVADEPRTIRKTCGKCPEGYATTGVTSVPDLCKDGEPILVQCVPLGGNMLSGSSRSRAGCRSSASAAPRSPWRAT